MGLPGTFSWLPSPWKEPALGTGGSMNARSSSGVPLGFPPDPATSSPSPKEQQGQEKNQLYPHRGQWDVEVLIYQKN